jgi:Ca-activated chloride channel homolog
MKLDIDPERDYYAILGVPTDADEQTIKRAYRQLARRYHPDAIARRNDQAEPAEHAEEVEPAVEDGAQTSAGSAERFREIQQAYELLADPQQREAYDHWRHQEGLDHPPAFVLRTIVSHELLPCLGESQTLYILVKISAAAEIESRRMPLNLCLVLDRSTSMKGTGLQQVKEAARYIVDQMGDSDVLSVISFSDRAEIVVAGQWPADKAAARAAISRIQADGGTELLQGLKAGLEELSRWRRDNMLNSLILLTDGQTYGDDQACLEEAGWAGMQHIQLVTMGVGPDWNDDLLDRMAVLSGGTSIYIDSAAKISHAFQEQVRTMGDVFAQNLTLLVHCGDGVEIRELFRMAPQINPLRLDDSLVALGLLEKQQPQVVLFELLVGSQQPGRSRLLHLALEGSVPAFGDQIVRIQQDVAVTCTPDLAAAGQIVRPPVPPDIVTAMGKLTIYKMQARAMAEVETGQIDTAVNRLKTMATRLLNIGEAELARAALLEAGYLAKTGSLSGEGRKKLRYGTRRLTIVPKEVRP